MKNKTYRSALWNYMRSIPKGVSHIRMVGTEHGNGTLVEYEIGGTIVKKVVKHESGCSQVD